MFIRVAPDFAVGRAEAQDFKCFKLVIAAGRPNLAAVGRALAGIASRGEEGHAG